MKPEYIGLGNFDENNYVYGHCQCPVSLEYAIKWPRIKDGKPHEYRCICEDCGTEVGVWSKSYGPEILEEQTKREALLRELAKEDLQVLALAYTYAKNIQMYGEDVTEKCQTATQKASALEKAYNKGYYDAMEQLSRKVKAKHYKMLLNSVYGIPREWSLKIKKVIFNEPATIVFWKNGCKTVVKCHDDEPFDPEKGLAMAIAKYALGNEGNYYNTFTKYLPKEDETNEKSNN